MKTIGTYGLIGAGVGAHFYGRSQYSQYLQMTYDNYRGASYTQAEIEQKYTLANTCRKATPVLISAGAAVWLYDIVWVAVKGHKPQKTSLNIDFDPQANNSFLSYSITF